MLSWDPRSQTNFGLGYGIGPVGPKYIICEHGWDFDLEAGWSHTLEGSRTLSILERIPMKYVGPDKVRNFKGLNTVWCAWDALNLARFAASLTLVYSLCNIAECIVSINHKESTS